MHTPVLLAGLVGSALVAAGGSLHAHLALTGGALWLQRLAQQPGAGTVGFVSAWAGLVLMTAAWLVLGRQVRGRPGGPARVVSTVAVWVVPLLVTPPLFSNDAWSYVAEGDLVSLGRSPYVATPITLGGSIVGAVGSTWANVPAPYGPLPMAWGGLVSDVSQNPWIGLLGFRVLALLALGALGWTVPRLARSTGVDPASATWWAVASPFTLVNGVSGAHLDLTVAALLSIAVLLAVRGRWAWGAVVVGAAAATKITALGVDTAVVLASMLRPSGIAARVGERARRGLFVVSLSAGTVLLLGLLSGLGTGWVRGLGTPLRHRSPLSPSTQLALRFKDVSGIDVVSALHVAALVALVAVATWQTLRGAARSADDVVRTAAVVTLATVLLSPVVHYWYFLWCLPFLGATALGPRARRVALAATIVLGLLAPADFSAGHAPVSAPLILLGLMVVAASSVRVRVPLLARRGPAARP